MTQQQNQYDINSIFPSNNLKGDDLLVSGPIIAVIEATELKTFTKNDGSGEETKPMLTFTDGKRMTCNSTQSRAIAKITESGDIRQWGLAPRSC